MIESTIEKVVKSFIFKLDELSKLINSYQSKINSAIDKIKSEKSEIENIAGQGNVTASELLKFGNYFFINSEKIEGKR